MKTLFAFLFTASLIACANTKTMSPESNQKTIQKAESDYFIISQGGGFTGKYETFVVYREGKIVLLTGESDSTSFGQLTPEKANSLFEALPGLGVTTQSLCAPGNMNYSLTVFLNGTKNTLTWADMVTPNAAIFSFFNTAMAEVRKAQR